jgi:hypothetical protein
MRTYLGLAAAVVFGLASLAQAGQIDLKDVSADVKWAAHLDVDGLVASSAFKKVRDEFVKQHPEAEAQLGMLRSVLHFDPLSDLHGITIYGTQLKKDTGVAIIRAKVDQPLLLEMVKNNPEHQVAKYGKYELHTWLKQGTAKHDNATFFRPDVIVFGASLDELKAALDVLDGTKPSLAGKDESVAGLIPPGAILVAGAKDLGEANLHPESSLLKKVDSAMLVVGEKDSQVFVRATLNVKDAEIAKQLKTVADGALAFLTLVKDETPDPAALKQLIDGVKVTLNDKSIAVEAQATVDLLWSIVQKEIAKKKAGQQHHGVLSGK